MADVGRIWVVAEQRDGAPLPVALELLTLARGLADTVDAFTWTAGGAGGGANIAGLVGEHGARRLYDLGDLGASLAGARVAASLAATMAQENSMPDAILIGTSYDGRDIAARLSARLDRPVLTNVVGLEVSDGVLVSAHAVFGGSEIVRARFTTEGPALFVVQAKSFAAETAAGEPAQVVAVERAEVSTTDVAEVTVRHAEPRSLQALDDASIVVSGGRGLGSKENFALVEELAHLLKGAPGATRALVDANWVPYSYQVGQTGRTVKPDVYIACGLSGATQHLAGMKGSKQVIAINRDERAPIFALADLAVVGDVTVVLPRLIEELKRRI